MDEFLTILPPLDTFDIDKFANTIHPLLIIANFNCFLYV